VYEDYREMLATETELDAVIIATPDFVHAEMAIACMEAGLDVYCEKEMAHNLDAARSMVEAEKRTGRLLQIGHQRRSNPIYQLALQSIDQDGLIGRITNCYAQWNKSVQELLTWPEKYEIPAETLDRFNFESMNHFRNWRWYRKYSGGPISDNGSHQIDIFGWFLHGNPMGLLASGGNDYYEGREWFSDVMAIYEYPYDYKGRNTTVRASYQVLNTNGFRGFFERYHGDSGTLTISEFHNLCAFAPEPATQLPEWASEVVPVQDGTGLAYPLLPLLAARSPEDAELVRQCEERSTYMWHLENFFNAVRSRNRKMLTCPGEEGFKTAAAVFGVTPAIESGSKLTFEANHFSA
jgi:predicted dehydrogenase